MDGESRASEIAAADTAEANALFEKASAWIDSGRPEEGAEAIRCLRRAHELAPSNLRMASTLGLAIARVERDFEQAKRLCETAIQGETVDADLFLNLALVYLGFERRAEGMRYLRRGQMIDPNHVRIAEVLGGLGRRRASVLPFLPRRHWLNRALGAALDWIASPFREHPVSAA